MPASFASMQLESDQRCLEISIDSERLENALMNCALYITRTGLLEPLGQSQVLSYLRGLARHYKIILITYEKEKDWYDARRIEATYAECNSLGIHWLPQRFRARSPLFTSVLSTVRMTYLVWRSVRKHGVQLIHARSYVPAAVAMLVGGLTRVPFIFDMRALWPEELIAAGRLRRGSMLHRSISALERICLKRAAGIVSLTNAAVEHLRVEYPSELSAKIIAVIPTCADLSRFIPATRLNKQKAIGCLGTILSGWFRLDWLISFLSVAARHDPTMRIRVCTSDNHAEVRTAFSSNPELLRRLEIETLPPQAVPGWLQSQLASVMFFTVGLSKLGSSPTRMGEVLGCGIPIVANDGVGDVAQIIRRYKVGVLVASSVLSDVEDAWHELQELLLDPDLSRRCRKAAEEMFSLESGTLEYCALYQKVLKEYRN